MWVQTSDSIEKIILANKIFILDLYKYIVCKERFVQNLESDHSGVRENGSGKHRLASDFLRTLRFSL